MIAFARAGDSACAECQCPGKVIVTRPYCPHGSARVVPGTRKSFARTLSSSVVRHKLINKKKEIVMWIEMRCFVFFAAGSSWGHRSVSGLQQVRSPAVPLVPCKELGVGVQLPNSAAGAARPGWSHHGSGARLGLTHRCLSPWLCIVEEFMASREGTRFPMAEHTLICPENGL